MRFHGWCGSRKLLPQPSRRVFFTRPLSEVETEENEIAQPSTRLFIGSCTGSHGFNPREAVNIRAKRDIPEFLQAFNSPRTTWFTAQLPTAKHVANTISKKN